MGPPFWRASFSFLLILRKHSCPIWSKTSPKLPPGSPTPSWCSLGKVFDVQILSLVFISVTLTVLYIVLSIKLIKEEREEKKQKAAAKKEEEQKKEEPAEEVQSSDSEKTLRKRKHASCD